MILTVLVAFYAMIHKKRANFKAYF